MTEAGVLTNSAPSVGVGAAQARRLPSALSPSSISTYEQCPKRFEYSRIDRIPDPSGPDAVLGTFVHAVLEDVLALAPEVRDIEGARAAATARRRTLEQDDEYLGLHLDEAAARIWRRRAWAAVSGYFALEDPRTVEVLGREEHVGVEIAGVAVRGIVDRIDRIEGGAAVVDYKTGKVPGVAYRGKALAQLELYAAMLAALGRPVRRVRLLYVSHGATIESDVGPVEVERAVARVARVDEAIRSDYATAFVPREGSLCLWCAYQGICPVMSD